LRKSGPSHGAIKEEDCDADEDLVNELNTFLV